MPGAAACAVAASSKTIAPIGTRSNCVFEIAFFMFIAFIAALLIDMDLGHQPAEVLGVVGEVVEIGGVEKEHLALRVARRVQNHVEGFATTQSDRVSCVVKVVSRLIPKQLGVVPDDLHWNPQGGE